MKPWVWPEIHWHSPELREVLEIGDSDLGVVGADGHLGVGVGQTVPALADEARRGSQNANSGQRGGRLDSAEFGASPVWHRSLVKRGAAQDHSQHAPPSIGIRTIGRSSSSPIAYPTAAIQPLLLIATGPI
jgi:hypothetical protein